MPRISTDRLHRAREFSKRTRNWLEAARERFSRGGLAEDAESPPYHLAFTLAAIVIALKAPDALTHPQFWAEDGTIFFAGQHREQLPVLMQPYASYLHVIPRSVAFLASGFPAVIAPTLYNWTAWLIGSFALASLRHIRLTGVPFIVLLAGIAFAPTNGEVFGTITNSQWLLQFYLLSTLARSVHGHQSRAPKLRVAVAVLVGLSGPFGVFAVAAALTLLAISKVHGRLAKNAAVAFSWTPELSALAICALVQLYVIFSLGTESVRAAPIGITNVTRVLSLVQIHLFTEELLRPSLFRALLLIAFAAPIVCARDRTSKLILLAVQIYIVLEGLALLLKVANKEASLAALSNGDRYFLVVKAYLCWQLAIYLAAVRRLSTRVRLSIVLALLGAYATVYAPFLSRPRLADLQWQSRAPALDAAEEVKVPINPIPWQLHVGPKRSR